MGVGIIIRDEKGNVIAATSEPVMATHDPATAEAIAALRAVEFCKEVGAFDINLEGDSLLVVKAICESQTSWLRYGQIIDDIKLVLGSLRSWSIRHIRREANVAAHVLAKYAILNFDSHVWLEETPSCILDTVILEQVALSL